MSREREKEKERERETAIALDPSMRRRVVSVPKMLFYLPSNIYTSQSYIYITVS